MLTVDLEELYTQQIKLLSPQDQLRLVAIVTQRLADQRDVPTNTPKRSLLELEGLGEDIWEGVDAQEYVNKLREEWDHRP